MIVKGLFTTPSDGSRVLMVNFAVGSLLVRIDFILSLKESFSYSRPGSRCKLEQMIGQVFVVSCGLGLSMFLLVVKSRILVASKLPDESNFVLLLTSVASSW